MNKIILDDFKLDFDDVLILQEFSDIDSRSLVNLNVEYDNIFKGIPIIATNLTTVGTIEAAKVLESFSMMTWLHKFYKFDEILNSNLNKNYFAPTIGLDYDVFQFSDYLKEFKYINVDVAHGMLNKYTKFISELKSKFPHLIIISGCVSRPEGVEVLRDALS